MVRPAADVTGNYFFIRYRVRFDRFVVLIKKNETKKSCGHVELKTRKRVWLKLALASWQRV